MNFGCVASIEFWYWVAANSCCHLKKKLAHTSAVIKGTALVCVNFFYFCTLWAIF